MLNVTYIARSPRRRSSTNLVSSHRRTSWEIRHLSMNLATADLPTLCHEPRRLPLRPGRAPEHDGGVPRETVLHVEASRDPRLPEPSAAQDASLCCAVQRSDSPSRPIPIAE